MKSIVILTTSFPRSEPGSEAAGSFVVDLCDSLSELCNVAVVAPGTKNTLEKRERFDVYRYRTPDKPLSVMRFYHPYDVVGIFKVLNAGAKATGRAVKETDPDALIALWALPCGFWARVTYRRTGIPYVVWCLGSDIWSLGKIPVIRGVLKSVLRSANHVFADGYQLARDVTALGGNKCGFLPSARFVDSRKPSTPRSKPPFRFIFVGRWHPNKGIDLMLQALSMLDSNDWRLIERIDVYGGGDLQKIVETEIDKLKDLGRPVFLHGYVDKPHAIAAIHSADWVIIPSRIESIPVIFSDAMQCHRPVICTPVGDLPELCNRTEIGYCVKEATPTALADGIRRAFGSNPTQFEDGMRSYAEIFSIKSAAQHLAGLCNINTRK